MSAIGTSASTRTDVRPAAGSDVITSASGPTDFANMKKVKFTRGGVTRQIDLRSADSPDAAIPAQPGDKIHVSQ
jgi:polysaccharide export outer membrane protein